MIGKSAFAKCLLLVTLSTQANAEHQKPEAKNDEERLHAMFEDNAFDVKKAWSLDTIRRYLYVGKRLCDDEPKEILNLWELHEARNSAADSISNLRAFVQARI